MRMKMPIERDLFGYRCQNPSLNVLCSKCRCHGNRCLVLIGGSLDFSEYYHACSPFRSVAKSPPWRPYETAFIVSTVPIPSACPKRQARYSGYPRWKQIVFRSGKSGPLGRVTDVLRSLYFVQVQEPNVYRSRRLTSIC